MRELELPGKEINKNMSSSMGDLFGRKVRERKNYKGGLIKREK